jgi:hypothetical protein
MKNEKLDNQKDLAPGEGKPGASVFNTPETLSRYT